MQVNRTALLPEDELPCDLAHILDSEIRKPEIESAPEALVIWYVEMDD